MIFSALYKADDLIASLCSVSQAVDHHRKHHRKLCIDPANGLDPIELEVLEQTGSRPAFHSTLSTFSILFTLT